MADYYVREEDGTSRYSLEDASGFLILDGVPTFTGAVAIDAVADISVSGTAAITRISQAPVEVVVLPTPKARLTQAPVEVVLRVDTAKARLSQAPVEVVVAPTDAKARLTQAPAEVVLQNLFMTVDFCIVEYRVREE